MLIEGKSFIVTGGTGSIGRDVARAIIAKGGTAVLFDVVPEEQGNGVAQALDSRRAFYFRVDITDKTACASAVQEAIEKIPKGSLAGCVHCAAISPGRPWSHKLLDSVDSFEKVLRVNVYGTFVVNACVADGINAQYPDEGPFATRAVSERGILINIASAVAHPVPARCLTYGPSKTAVLGISSGMADFLGPFGIRVCSVSPAVVASGMMGPERVPYFQSELEAGAVYPRRLSALEEVSYGITYLIENSMMNDFELRIDGGWRGSSNWGAKVDPRSNAPSLE